LIIGKVDNLCISSFAAFCHVFFSFKKLDDIDTFEFVESKHRNS